MSSALKKFVSLRIELCLKLASLTARSAVVNMIAGAIQLLRRITTCLVLVALAGIYAMPLAAAFSRNALDCCTAGMCPLPKHGVAHHHMHEEMPDCDGTSATGGSVRKCDMAACDTLKTQAVNVGLFVLSAPTGIVRSSAHVPVLVSPSQSEHSVSKIPATPPPRISLS
jgi:hypothetical protein